MVSSIKPLHIPIQLFPTTTIVTYNPSRLPAASISELEKVEKLGRGSKGIVYKVVHKVTGDIHALKTYNNSANLDEFIWEIKTLESIDCNYITRFHGTVFSEPAAADMAILTEYMDAGTLQNLVKINGTLSEKMITTVARRTLLGLEYLHNTKHIVHYDIKPANLLVNQNMEVKIADLGVCKLID